MKFKIFKSRKTNTGFSLLETLIAIGISSIVLTSALGVVASIHYGQKRLQFTQDFYAEGRYLMERMAQVIRNNTIDYDYFFVQAGPADSGAGVCGTDFDADQVPSGALTTNDADNRADLGYETVFFWDTNGDGNQNRNLGGKHPDGIDPVDLCTYAWEKDAALTDLYLINASRTTRTAISFDAGGSDITMRRQLVIDTDSDGKGDVWGPYDPDNDGYDASSDDTQLVWNSVDSVCEMTYYDTATTTNLTLAVLGESASEDFCDQAYAATSIVPPGMSVENLTFRPAPNQDPFLAFRVEAAQVQPHVFVYLDLGIDDPSRYGFEVADSPRVSFQTTVGSRVFGNIRR